MNSSQSSPQNPDEGPLRGQTVLVTRALDQAQTLQKQLEAHGANVVVQPAIQILALTDQTELDHCIWRLPQFGRTVFASRNAAKFFFERVTQLNQTKALLQTSLTAIGQSTAELLKHLTGAKKIETPICSNSDSLAELLISGATQERVLIIRANRGSHILQERLTQAQIEFEEVVAYQSTDIEQADPQIIQQMSGGKIDWVTLTSSAIAKSTIHLFGNHLKKSKTVSISPTTSQALRDGGFEPDAEAIEYNMPGIVAAILDAERSR